MTRLISQYERDFGPSEEDEAFRLRAEYQWQRACTLAHVFENTLPRPYRAFWFRVGALLAGQNDGVMAVSLRKEREVAAEPVSGRLYVTVNGVRISRTEYERFLNHMILASA